MQEKRRGLGASASHFIAKPFPLRIYKALTFSSRGRGDRHGEAERQEDQRADGAHSDWSEARGGEGAGLGEGEGGKESCELR